jgi:hypothetical protein
LKYEDIIIPDKKLKEIKSQLSKLPQKWIQLLIDYLNYDKYLLIQWVMKTMNNKNAIDTISYLDWALSRIDWLIVTLGKFLKEHKEDIV